MKLSHKILICVATFYLSVSSTLTWGVEAETQSIIDNANALDQKLQEATAPKKFCYGTDNYSTVTANGISVDAIPCNDPSLQGELCPAAINCYLIIY